MARPGPATGGRAADSRTGAVGWQDRADGRVARYRAADVSDSGSFCDRRQRGYRPAARSSPARHANERQHLASQRALPFFSQKLLDPSSTVSAALSSIDSASSFFSLRFSSSSSRSRLASETSIPPYLAFQLY